MRLPDIARSPAVRRLVRAALREDVGRGDVTSLALVPESARARAAVLARERGVVAGAGVAVAVFRAADPAVRCRILVPDGRTASPGEAVLRVAGPARGILAAERTALNFLQRMSGVATLTRRFVDRVGGRGVAILDTRKTTPGLRALEKYAVRCGGGQNHRMGLYDRVLIKDNHRRLWRRGRASRLDEAVAEARRRWPGLAIEVEVETEEELLSALKARPEWILLDNMSPARLRRFAALGRGRCRFEASGGVTLANVGAVSRTGVDAISLGCLTHSAPAVDFSLEFE